MHGESPGKIIFVNKADATTEKSDFTIPREPSNKPKTAPVGKLSSLTPRERRKKPQEETFVYVNPNLQTRGKFGSPKNGVKRVHRASTRATNVSSMRIKKSVEHSNDTHHHQKQIHDTEVNSSNIGTKNLGKTDF